MLTWMFDRFPRVEPPGMSLRFAYACNGTPASSHTARNTARLNASVQYFWFAASFTARPALRRTWFSPS